MAYTEVPSDDVVVEAIRALGGTATALALCNSLVALGHPRRDSQLAIQRAAEHGRLHVESDWRLRIAEAEVVAA